MRDYHQTQPTLQLNSRVIPNACINYSFYSNSGQYTMCPAKEQCCHGSPAAGLLLPFSEDPLSPSVWSFALR